MTFSLKKALKAVSDRITPEQRAEQETRTRAGIGRIDPNSPAAKARRARTLEASVLNQIMHLEKEPESELKTTRMNVALNRLSELRAEQGDYAGAATLTHDEKRAKHYKTIEKAIKRKKKGPSCECPTFQVRDGKRIATLSPRFKAQTIVTENGPRNLMLCATCKSMYVE